MGLYGSNTPSAFQREILQRLQLHHVSDDSFIGNLIIDAGVVYFAVIDHGIERNAGESFFKSGLDAILLFRSITTGINDELAAFFQGRLIKLFQIACFIRPLSKLSYFKIADGSNECKA